MNRPCFRFFQLVVVIVAVGGGGGVVAFQQYGTTGVTSHMLTSTYIFMMLVISHKTTHLQLEEYLQVVIKIIIFISFRSPYGDIKNITASLVIVNVLMNLL